MMTECGSNISDHDSSLPAAAVHDVGVRRGPIIDDTMVRTQTAIEGHGFAMDR